MVRLAIHPCNKLQGILPKPNKAIFLFLFSRFDTRNDNPNYFLWFLDNITESFRFLGNWGTHPLAFIN